MKIEYVNLKRLELYEQNKLKELVEINLPKLQHVLKDINLLKIMVKTFDKTGNRKRIVLEIIAASPKLTFHASPENHHHYAEWDISKAAHKTMKNLINEMNHHLKPEQNTGWRKYKLMQRAKNISSF